MGHDVCHIGQHNLNINSLEELASDLSKRRRYAERGVFRV